MAALLEGFGPAKAEVIAAFRKRLEAQRGTGRISLAGCAYVASVTVAPR
jgi:hypothetical protein